MSIELLQEIVDRMAELPPDIAQSLIKTKRVTGTAEDLVTATPTVLLGYYANNGSSGNAEIRDADELATGNTAILHVDATAYASLTGVKVFFENGITVDGSAAGTDITVLYVELDKWINN